VAALVVGGDSNIDPVEGRVGVAESDHGDVHVGSFSEGLVVETGVAHDQETGLEELLGVVVGEGTGNPLSTEVVGAGVSSELEHGALGELTRRHDEDVVLVLGLDGGDDPGGDHDLLPGLGQVEVVDTVAVAPVDVVAHLLGHVLGTNVHLGGDHLDEIVFSVLGVKEGHV